MKNCDVVQGFQQTALLPEFVGRGAYRMGVSWWGGGGGEGYVSYLVCENEEIGFGLGKRSGGRRCGLEKISRQKREGERERKRERETRTHTRAHTQTHIYARANTYMRTQRERETERGRERESERGSMYFTMWTLFKRS